MNHITRRLQNNLLSTCVTAVLTLLGPRSEAQTYFYLEQITVDPASPTTTDAIMITVSGNLSNTAAHIVSTSFSLSGNTVQLIVNAAFDGIGLDVLVPHEEQIPIGNLAAGTYTILVNGTAVADLAPSPQHQFVVSGGTPSDCDSLEIISVHWGVFGTDRLVVTAANGSSDLFDYPGFVMLDMDGDTLAKETVNYFGIGVLPQEHLLEVVDGAVIDGNTLQGQLHLWSGFYAEQECQFEGTWELCPTTACTSVTPYLVNLGDAIVAAEIPYSVLDADGLPLATGTFQITSLQQSDYEPGVCLAPGEYSLQLAPITPVGGQLYHGMSADMMNFQREQAFYEQGGGQNTLPFTVYAACIDGSNGVSEGDAPAGTVVTLEGDQLIVMNPDGRPIGAYQLIDGGGRTVRSGVCLADRERLSMTGSPRGMYLFRAAGPVGLRIVY
ncbi:MAG: hypothetical protein KA791_09595 [Flavobacteriales bacterium]|nr:hypothetical protein [Flavobacteriales bacterium]